MIINRSFFYKPLMMMAYVCIFLLLLLPISMKAAEIEDIATGKQNNYIVRFTDPPLSKVKRFKQDESSFSPQSISNAQSTLNNRRMQFKDDLTALRKNSGSGLFLAPYVQQTDNQETVFQHEYSYLLSGVALSLSADEADAVRSLPYVENVYPDLPVCVLLNNSHPIINADMYRQETGATGSGIVIAIIDTGIDYLHPDLGGGIGPSYKVIGGYDFINEDDDPMDDNGHGTHCAGIAAANGTLQGIAPNAKLIAYKVLNTEGNGIFSDIIAALERAADPDEDPLTDDQVDIVSISIGGSGTPDDPISLAVDNAMDQGILCVIAAGNEGDYYSITSPGCARKALTVGAVDSDSYIAAFSSRGPTREATVIKPDLTAPGVGIYSTLPDGTFGYKSGTSMATPFVSGASALVLQMHPSLTSFELKNLLKSTAANINEDTLTQGSGLLDMSPLINLTTIVDPATVFLGAASSSESTWTTSTNISVKNISASQINYAITWEDELNPGVIESALVPSLTIDSGSSTSFSLTLTVNTEQLPIKSEPYMYEGNIHISDGSSVYTIKVLFQYELPDPYEPNNMINQSYPITMSARRSLLQDNARTTINPFSGEASYPDYDWFSFSCNEGDVITLDINAKDIGSSLNALLTLYDSNGTVLTSNDTYGYYKDPVIRNYTIGQDGTLHVRVSASGNSTTGQYHLITSKKPDINSWYTDISSVSIIDLADNGRYTVIAGSTELQVLDNLNDGLQIWQVSNTGIIDMSAADGADTVAVLSSAPYKISCYATASNVPQWSFQFPDNVTPSDISVSRDGSTIAVYSESSAKTSIIIYVFKRVSPTPYWIYTQTTNHINNLGFEINATGSCVLFSDKNTSYILDTQQRVLRWSGPCAERSLHMNGDGSIIVGSTTSYLFSAKKWNGTYYETLWDYNPGNGTKIFRSAVSADGSCIVMGQRLNYGLYGLDDDGLLVYIFNINSGQPIYSYHIPKDALLTPRDDLLGVKLPSAIDEIGISDDGKNIVISTWGADPTQPELFVFSPEYQYPLGTYYSHGSINDMSYVNDRLSFISEGKHNFNFFRSGIQQELVSLSVPSLTQAIPPFIRNASLSPAIRSTGIPITLSSEVSDSDGVSSVTAKIYFDNDTLIQSLTMLSQTTPNTYTGQWTPSLPANYYYIITADDHNNNTSFTKKSYFTTYPQPSIALLSVQLESGSAYLHPAEPAYIRCNISNVGNVSTGTLTVALRIADPYIESYTRTTVTVDSLSSGESSLTQAQSLRIEPSNTIPDQYTFTITIDVTDDAGNMWNLTTNLTALDNRPPDVSEARFSKYLYDNDTTGSFTVRITDGTPVQEASVELRFKDNDQPAAAFALYDDGLHGDTMPHDGIYGSTFIIPYYDAIYYANISVADSLNNDKVYSDQAQFSSVPYQAHHAVLIVDDTSGDSAPSTRITADFSLLGISVDTWDTGSLGQPPLSVLLQYRTGGVVWICGLLSSLTQFDDSDQALLIRYLNQGGNLLLFGERITYYLTDSGKQANTFINDYLNIEFVFKDTNGAAINGITDTVSESLTFTVPTTGYTAEIDPSDYAISVLQYSNGITYSSKCAAVMTDMPHSYRCFFADFDISILSSEVNRRTMINAVLAYFSRPVIQEPEAVPKVLLPENQVLIVCSIADPDGIHSVSAMIKNSAGTQIAALTLTDDGLTGDQTAGDYVYSKLYTTPASPSTFSVTVTATDTFLNETAVTAENLFTTEPNPFLTISSIIPHNGSLFKPGNMTEFDIVFSNNGTSSFTGAIVVLDIDDPYVDYYSTQSVTIGAIGAGSSFATVNGSFYLKLSNLIPHNYDLKIPVKLLNAPSVPNDFAYSLTVEDTEPPLLVSFDISPRTPLPGSTLTFSALVEDGSGTASAKLVMTERNSRAESIIYLFDDGMHSDGIADNHYYGNSLTAPDLPGKYDIDLYLSDTIGNAIIKYNVSSFTTSNFTPANQLLVVYDDTDTGSSLYWLIDFLKASSIPYDLYETDLYGEISESIFQSYTAGAVIWIAGTTSEGEITVNELNAISSFLEHGGNLLMYGDNLSYRITAEHGASFLRDYFFVSHLKKSIQLQNIQGSSSASIADGMSFTLTDGSLPGELSVLPQAEPLLYIDASSQPDAIEENGTAAVTADTGVYRIVFIDFRWDAIHSNSSRFSLMTNILAWLGIQPYVSLLPLSIIPSQPSAGNTLTIELPVSGHQTSDPIYALIESPDEYRISKLILFDDGTHGDGYASDSIFSRSLLLNETPALYYIDIEVDRENDTNLFFDNHYSFSTDLKPNLIFDGYSITDTHLQPGDISYIHMYITNNGLASAGNVEAVVSLKDEYIDFYNQSPLKFGSISPGSTATAGQSAFYIALKESCPDNYTITGHIYIESIAGYRTLDIVTFTVHDTRGPVLDSISITPRIPQAGMNARFDAAAIDGSGVQAVEAEIYNSTGTLLTSIPMNYDNDSHLYFAYWTTPLENDNFSVSVRAVDNLANELTSEDVLFFSTHPFIKKNSILFVQSENTSSTANFLISKGYSFDIWDKQIRGIPDTSVLLYYKDDIVIYDTGIVVSPDDFHSSEESALNTYYDNGGNVLLLGSGIVSVLTSNGVQSNLFLNNTLHIEYASSSTYPDISGTSGDIFNSLSFALGGNKAGVFTVTSPATGILQPVNTSNPDWFSGSRIADNDSKALFLPLSLMDISFAEDRSAIIAQSLSWLSGGDSAPVVSDLGVEPSVAEPSDIFTFSVTITANSGISSASVKIYNNDLTVNTTVPLYDDGVHLDGSAGDSFFATQWISPSAADTFSFDLSVSTNSGKTAYRNNAATVSTFPRPVVVFDHYTLSSPGIFVANQMNYFDLYIRNDGNASANNVTVKITADTPYIDFITTSSAQYGNISSGVIKKQSGAKLSLKTTEGCPDNAVITINITANDNNNILHTDSFTITIHDLSIPELSAPTLIPSYPEPDAIAALTVTAFDASGIQNISAALIDQFQTTIDTIQLYDDGSHNDELAGDGIFSNLFTVPSASSHYKIIFQAADAVGNNGFSAEILWFSTIPFEKRNELLLVDYSITDPTIKSPLSLSLETLGIGYDVWQPVIRNDISSSILSLYTNGTVIYEASSSPDSVQRNLVSLTEYMHNGGTLFLFGDNIAYTLSANGINANTLLDEYFHIRFIQIPTPDTSLTCVDSSFNDNLSMTISAFTAGEIDPLEPAYPILKFTTETNRLSSGTVMSINIAEDFIAGYADFPFDAIEYATQQNTLLKNIIDYIGIETGVKLAYCSVSPQIAFMDDTITISANITSASPITTAAVDISDLSGNNIASFNLYDNGTHGDTIAGDNIFSNIYTVDSTDTIFYVNLSVETASGLSSYFPHCAEFYTTARPILSIASYSLVQTASVKPGEYTQMNITLNNSGTASAQSVYATLSVSDEYMDFISTIPVSYGDIASGVSVTNSASTFRFRPSYDCPDNHLFEITLSATDSAGITHTDILYITVTDTTPPQPSASELSQTTFMPGDSVVITSLILEGSGIDIIQAVLSNTQTGYNAVVTLQDNGIFPDQVKNDMIFSGTFITPPIPQSFHLSLYTKDLPGNSMTVDTGLRFTTEQFITESRLLLLDDDGGITNQESQYQSILSYLNIPFDYWDSSLRGSASSELLEKYRNGAVLLFTGTNSSIDRVSSEEQYAYQSYLNSGGSLMMTGSNNSYLLTNYGITTNTLLNSYFHAQFQSTYTGNNTILSVDDIWFSTLILTDLAYGSTGECDPISPGTAIIQYTDHYVSSGTAAIKTDTSTYKTLFYDFKIEDITSSSQKNIVLDRSVKWLYGPEITDYSLSKRYGAPGTPVDIFCTVGQSQPISLVKAYIYDKNTVFVTSITLYDNGTSPDVTASDGIYSGRFSSPASNQTYSFILQAYTSNTYSRYKTSLSYTTRSIPVLGLTNIRFENGNFTSGISQNIAIDIKNHGPVNADAVTVALSFDDPYVTSAESTVVYGTVTGGSTYISPSFAFNVHIRNDIPHGHVIKAIITMKGYYNSTQYSYTTTYPIVVSDTTAPSITEGKATPRNNEPNSLITIQVHVIEGTAVHSIIADIYTDEGIIAASLPMYDDGSHSDNESTDSIYGAEWITEPTPAQYKVSITAEDSQGNNIVYTDCLHFTTKQFVKKSPVLLVYNSSDSDSLPETFINTASNLGYSCDRWNNLYRGTLNESITTQYQYGAVILLCDDEGINLVSNDDYTALSAYLEYESNLLITGSNIALNMEKNPLAMSFLNTVFNAVSVIAHTGALTLNPAELNQTGLTETINFSAGSQIGELDIIAPARQLYLLSNQAYSSGTAAVSIEKDAYRAILCDFSIGDISSPSEYTELVDGVLSWLLDRDNDALIDDWEITYFGSRKLFNNTEDPDNDGLNNAQEMGFKSNPTIADTDNDSASDHMEYIAATDPNDPASKFIIIDHSRDFSGITLTWQSVPFKTYKIFYTEMQGGTFIQIGSVTATGTETIYIDSGAPPERLNPAAKESGFYFITVSE
ncbi:MAG: hypothetical protein C4541_05560 [Candidatus Auribacter fodinae]|uniref:Peptidase S8/S53 domain-containing protein n=1 Tax=Candidatus Auribacter fodinae TaxID=2093366 RepID=A0A3A4R4Y0_9BACT|nr:MAG: hypothetical protein C4541_05560 [Candidatus Auribacter fodinae]